MSYFSWCKWTCFERTVDAMSGSEFFFLKKMIPQALMTVNPSTPRYQPTYNFTYIITTWIAITVKFRETVEKNSTSVAFIPFVLNLSPTSRDPAERLVLALVLPRLRGRVLVLSTVVPPVRICLTEGLWPGFSCKEFPWECICPPWECTRPPWGIKWPCPWGNVLIVPKERLRFMVMFMSPTLDGTKSAG